MQFFVPTIYRLILSYFLNYEKYRAIIILDNRLEYLELSDTLRNNWKRRCGMRYDANETTIQHSSNEVDVSS